MSASRRATVSGGDVEAAARDYLRRGRAVTPCEGKRPILNDWPSRRLTEADLPHHFGDGANIGLILGQPSCGLTDVDLDAPEAVGLGPPFLPPRNRTHGRASKPGSHWWYASDPALRTEKYGDLDGTMLVELRANGAQTVVPPSVHESGEVLRWVAEGEPVRVEPDVLRVAVRRVAAAALLARHWPEQGNRHRAALALAGLLLNGGMPEAEALTFVEAVAQAAGDEETPDRARALLDTAREIEAGGATTGGPTLAALLPNGEKVLARVREWLGLGGARGREGASTEPVNAPHPGPTRPRSTRSTAWRAFSCAPSRPTPKRTPLRCRCNSWSRSAT